MDLGSSVCSEKFARTVVLFGAVITLSATDPTCGASFEAVRQRASALAGKRYEPPTQAKLPQTLEKMDYNQFQLVQFHSEHAPWSKDQLKFDLLPFPRGF